MASALVLLVALSGVAVARWAQRAGGHPSCMPGSGWNSTGIQLGTLQGMESGIKKLDANFKLRAKSPRMSPGAV